MPNMRSSAVFRKKAAPLLERSPSALARIYNKAAINLIVVKHRVPWLRALSVPILLKRHSPFWVTDRSELLVLKDIYLDGSYAESALPTTARTILDLGANVGFASRFFRGRYPEARIIAYEARAATAAVARRNMASDLHFELNVAAIAGESGVVSLDEDAGHSWSTRIREHTPGSDGVQSESLDAVLRRHAPVDILKIDIEGAEYAAFESCDALDLVDLIVGEIHANEHRSPADFLAMLEGFEVLRWDIVDGTGPFVARRLRSATP
jgi:FkbM family methyltransferase